MAFWAPLSQDEYRFPQKIAAAAYGASLRAAEAFRPANSRSSTRQVIGRGSYGEVWLARSVMVGARRESGLPRPLR